MHVHTYTENDCEPREQTIKFDKSSTKKEK